MKRKRYLGQNYDLFPAFNSLMNLGSKGISPLLANGNAPFAGMGNRGRKSKVFVIMFQSF